MSASPPDSVPARVSLCIASLRTRSRRVAALLTLNCCIWCLSPAESRVPAGPTRLSFAELVSVPTLGTEAATSDSLAQMPASLRQLDGREVEITGYMLPLRVERGRARQFLILRTQLACCFGQMPGPTEYLVAETTAPGVEARLDMPTTFQGKLRIAPVTTGHQITELYHLDNTVLSTR